MTSVPNPKPGKFSKSAPFRRLLAEFVVEDNGDPYENPMFIVHEGCGAEVVMFESDRGLDVLVQACIDHDC